MRSEKKGWAMAFQNLEAEKGAASEISETNVRLFGLQEMKHGGIVLGIPFCVVF